MLDKVGTVGADLVGTGMHWVDTAGIAVDIVEGMHLHGRLDWVEFDYRKEEGEQCRNSDMDSRQQDMLRLEVG